MQLASSLCADTSLTRIAGGVSKASVLSEGVAFELGLSVCSKVPPRRPRGRSGKRRAKQLQMSEPREPLGLQTRVTARVCSVLRLNALFI